MQSSNTNNSCGVQDEFKYTLYKSVFSLVFVVGLVFNMVALYIFTCTLKQRNGTTICMLNLVVSDTLFVLSLPLRIFYFVTRKWYFGVTLCKLSVAVFYTNMYGSILFLTCISVDRFLAIVYPFAFRSLCTRRNAKIVCTVVWLVVLSGSLSVGFKVETTGENSTLLCFEKYNNTQWQSTLSKVVVFMETVGFVIPLLVNVFCSTMILRTLRNRDVIDCGWQLKKTKILRMIVVHLVIFCLCFTPFNINLVFYTLVRSNVIQNCTVEYVVKTIYPIAFCLTVLNCCCDPIIYYFTSETIQNSIRRKSHAARSDTKNYNGPSSNVTSIRSFRILRAKFMHNESSV